MRASGYMFAVDCRDCGNDLRAVTESRHTGTETTAIARCDACGNEFYIAVQLRRLPSDVAIRKRRWRERVA